MGGGNQYVQKYEFYMTFVKVYIYTGFLLYRGP